MGEENLQQLATYLQQTLSPDPNIRRPGAHLFYSFADLYNIFQFFPYLRLEIFSLFSLPSYDCSINL